MNDSIDDVDGPQTSRTLWGALLGERLSRANTGYQPAFKSLAVCGVCCNPCTFFCCCNPCMAKSVTRVLFFLIQPAEKKCHLLLFTRGLHKKKTVHGLRVFSNTRVTPKNKVHGLHFFSYVGSIKNKVHKLLFFNTQVTPKNSVHGLHQQKKYTGCPFFRTLVYLKTHVRFSSPFLGSPRRQGLCTPPPPLSKLRPCPSYSRRRDRINLVPNFNSVPNLVQPHKTWV